MKHKTTFLGPIMSHILVYGIAGLFILGGIFALWAATLRLPDFNSLIDRRIAQSTKIYDRTGKVLLYDMRKPGDAVECWSEPNSMSPVTGLAYLPFR